MTDPPPVNPASKKRLRLSLQAVAVKMSVVGTRSMMPLMVLHQCLVHPCSQVIASHQKKRMSRRA